MVNLSTNCDNDFIDPCGRSKIHTRAGPTRLAVEYFAVIVSRSSLRRVTNDISAQYSVICLLGSESPRNFDKN